MGYEIERKFLVDQSRWSPPSDGVPYRQGYLSQDLKRVVRIRLAGEKGYLTIKGVTTGISRREFEYEIPVCEARDMLDHMCHRPQIEKMRYLIPYQGFTWEVDEFSGENEGLIVAEIELQSESDPFSKPEWVGQEVSEDPRYYNVNLIANPYRRWKGDI